MKGIINIIIVSTLLMGIFMVGGCADLDREYSNTYDKEDLERQYTYRRNQCNVLYTTLEEGYTILGNGMRASATDEAKHTYQGATQSFNTGSWNAATNPDNGSWTRYFQGIYRVNDFLASSIEVDLSDWQQDLSEGGQIKYQERLVDVENFPKEARFLRAYFYFELIKRFGGVPIITDPVVKNTDYSRIKRNTLQECIDFIVSECEYLGGNDGLLPVYRESEMSRVERGAALALKSRLLLYAASDLWNDPDWANTSDPEILSLISVTGDRREKWKAAADAAKELIDYNIGGISYSIASNYYQYIGLRYDRSGNNEILLVYRPSGSSNTFERLNYPIGNNRGQGNVTPSQNLVDDFEMLDGSKFDWNNPIHAANPYGNRDPRLNLTVLHNGSVFGSPNPVTLEIYQGGLHGSGQPNATTTGYYLRKLLDPNLNLSSNGASYHTWTFFRMGEIYLNYAEALNEYDPGNPDIAGYASMTRGRSGVNMPPIPGDLSQNEMREKIRNERRIELSFEDHRYWDALRWKIAAKAIGGALYKMVVTPVEGGGFTYRKEVLENRVFDESKMYFYPIPLNVMLNEQVVAAKWRQNPGWE
ncbi:MAG: RagB/SusD family nutrient uptake outer membrane protein [Dysgonamonadaceae bacterium]|nr:RagB/SusD family nutrient uptake outer membrane protein [Dysgonamonadaceae bacterium]